MEKFKDKICYLCSSKKQLIDYDDESGICQKCYDEQTKEADYYKSIRTNKYPQIDDIADGIYLGNEDGACQVDMIKERKITAICACGSHLLTPFRKDPAFEYKIYEIADFPKQPIKQYFQDHYQWIKKMQSQGRNILMHCSAGVSRSGSFTIAFFMRDKCWPFEKAKEFVKQKRRCVNPNSGFRAQLIQYEADILTTKKQILPLIKQ